MVHDSSIIFKLHSLRLMILLEENERKAATRYARVELAPYHLERLEGEAGTGDRLSCDAPITCPCRHLPGTYAQHRYQAADGRIRFRRSTPPSLPICRPGKSSKMVRSGIPTAVLCHAFLGVKCHNLTQPALRNARRELEAQFLSDSCSVFGLARESPLHVA